MNGVKVLERIGDGLYAISFKGQGKALWSRCKLRKNCRCAATDKPLSKGEMHYSPIGHMQYRGRRLSLSFVETGRSAPTPRQPPPQENASTEIP